MFGFTKHVGLAVGTITKACARVQYSQRANVPNWLTGMEGRRRGLVLVFSRPVMEGSRARSVHSSHHPDHVGVGVADG